jgi:phenylacetate-CoA ligase
MLDERPADVLAAYREFFDGTESGGEERVLRLFHDVAGSVPAYQEFLRDHEIDPQSISSLADFRGLPLMTKDTYLRRHPLPRLCRGGRIDDSDMIAVSSGSTGRPTIWPRSLVDELHIARRFEQIFRDGFGAAGRSTLAVVCFPLGTWVGGLFTASCVRHLAAKGYPITVVAPGNNKGEILRVLPELGPHFDQVVLLGYPPFVKDVIDTGVAEGLDWSTYAIKLVLAGEVFSEEWRDLVARRAGMANPVTDSASLYGTADAGVLGNETPLSVSIRRFLAGRPELASELFGDLRLPTLVQYDPGSRFFEAKDGTLLFSGDSGIPLIRYHIADEGGVLPYRELLDVCVRHGFEPVPGPELPFVYVFGRSLFAVSFFGANVYPENVAVALEQPVISEQVTGKFVLETVEDEDRNRRLRITVELAPGRTVDTDAFASDVAASVRDQLQQRNSEYAHYVPADQQLPQVQLRATGDAEYFPVGVKHRYTRQSPGN